MNTKYAFMLAATFLCAPGAVLAFYTPFGNGAFGQPTAMGMGVMQQPQSNGGVLPGATGAVPNQPQVNTVPANQPKQDSGTDGSGDQGNDTKTDETVKPLPIAKPI